MPIVLALKVDTTTPIRRGQDHFWSVIRDLTCDDRGRAFGPADILRSSDPEVRWGTVASFLRVLTRAGILEEVPGETKRWRALRRPTRLPRLSADGRIVPSGQQQMWEAMRALDAFTAIELAYAASTEECRVAPAAAKDYVGRLARAGYLKVEREGRPGRPAAYRLRPSRDTGPAAPMILKTKLLYDPNEGEIVGPVTMEGER